MSLEFVIEKNIPAPLRSSGRPAYYAFERCDVGDSFLVPNDEHPECYQSSLGQRLRWAIKRYRKDHPHTKWRTKTMSKGVRIWRIA